MQAEREVDKPFISPEQQLPEITVKAVVISFFLIIILAASNAYLGLKMGTTISAAIPAVVISMGLFKLFRRYNVLELNIIQTAASVGEGITAGIVFTIPALVIMHFWHGFYYWSTVGIAILGGMLGVLFSIPVRRALLKDRTLRFPEGLAIGHVMKASASGGASVRYISMGGLVGALAGLFQTGFRIFADSYDYWLIKGKLIFGFSMGFSPAVLAAGYICGVNVGLSLLVGVVIGWTIGIPFISGYFGIPAHLSAGDAANYIWLNYIRYVGVGTMLFGGLWTLVTLFKPVVAAVKSSLDVLHDMRVGNVKTILRTEHDMPINFVFWGVFLLALLIALELFILVKPEVLGVGIPLYGLVLLTCVVYLVIAGFIFSSISGYFSGLVGATNSPGSGLMIASLLVLAFILLLILSPVLHFSLHPDKALLCSAIAVMICSFIGCAVVMAGEATQDFKAGQMIGGTPWKQQLTLLGSVIIAALVIPLILMLLYNAYGIGGVFPHAGMSHSEMLAAPQAGLVAAIAQGVFSRALPWNMVFLGVGIAVVCLAVDELLKFFLGWRLPVLAVGLGIYLPMSASMPIVVGGVLSYIVQHALHTKYGVSMDGEEAHTSPGLQRTILLSCGLVAGATLIGVVLAIPFAIKQSADALRLVPMSFGGIGSILSAILTVALCYWIYRSAIQAHKDN